MMPHAIQAEVAPGLWAPARPLQGTGVARRLQRRRCLDAGGHCEHPATPRDPAYCCGCGRPAHLRDRLARR